MEKKKENRNNKIYHIVFCALSGIVVLLGFISILTVYKTERIRNERPNVIVNTNSND